MITPATAGATCVRKKFLNPLLVLPGLIRLPCIVGRLPLLDFAGMPIHPVAVDSRTRFRGSVAFGVVNFADHKTKIGIGRLFGAERNTIPGNSLIVNTVVLKRALEQRQSSVFIQRTGTCSLSNGW